MELYLHKEELGLTAKGKRKIAPGKQFETFFPKPVNTDPILKKDGSVKDTVSFCEDIVKKTLGDTKQIAQYLKRPQLKDTCKAIFDFFYQHYQYQLDKTGVEQLRRPARAWQDRGNSNGGGVDCDCFSISVSSILINLGIPHSFRIVKMYGRDFYQHIYVVVPKFKGADMKIRCNYYVIDPVLDKFDHEAPDITKKTDKPMTMPIQYLNGVGEAYTPRLGKEFDGLGSGLGCASGDGLYRDFLKRQKMHLINTRNHIAKYPHKVSRVYRPSTLRGMYDTLIGAWDDDTKRDAVLEHLSGIEDEALQPEFRGLGSVIHSDDAGLWSVVNGDLAGLGKAKAKASGKKAGVFTKIKNATKKVAAVTKTAVKKTGAAVKTVAKKTGAVAKIVAKKAVTVAKKVGAAVVKYNPVSLTARLGFLLAMKTNFNRLASRAYWGYFSESEAKAKGITSSYYQKSKQLLAKMQQVFSNTLKGNADELKKAILTGRGAKKAPGVSGLGVVATAASITAALAFITPIIAFAKNIFGKSNGTEEAESGGAITPPADEQAAATDTSASSADAAPADESSPNGADGGDNSGGGKSKTGMIVGALAAAGLAIGIGVAVSKGKKNKSEKVSGVGNPHKKKSKSRKKKSIETIKLS